MKVNALRRQPPRKRSGQGVGPRTIDGAIMDLRHGAVFFGETQKMLRAQVARGTVPHRRFGGRIIFIRAELEEFLKQLDGCSVRDAIGNILERK